MATLKSIPGIEEGKIFKLEPNGKYLLILPKDSEITKISAALTKFFKPTKFFVLAVNDVTEIKIAELLSNEQE